MVNHENRNRPVLRPERGSVTSATVSQAERGRKEDRIATLTPAALGVAFGDIAKSPVYALRECFRLDPFAFGGAD